MKFKKKTEKVIQMIGNRACAIVADVFEPETPRGTIFCLHGLFGSGADFTDLAEFLAGNGLRAICPDLLGRGRSTFLDDPDGYGLPVQLDTVRTLMSRFGTGRDSLIGAGASAVVAFSATTASIVSPARVILSDLVLRNTPALTGMVQVNMELLSRSFESPEDIKPFLEEQMNLWGVAGGRVNYGIIERNLRQTGDRYRVGCDSAFAFSLDQQTTFDFRPLLRAIKVPTLLLYGDGSIIYDHVEINKITDANRNVKCVPRLGEYNVISYEDYPVFAIILGFITQIAAN